MIIEAVRLRRRGKKTQGYLSVVGQEAQDLILEVVTQILQEIGKVWAGKLAKRIVVIAQAAEVAVITTMSGNNAS